MNLKEHIHINPWQYLIASFIILIGIGTLLLNLPIVTYDGTMHFVDTLFVSTSAVCVTGLSTISTSGFNWVGELVLLILMQLGAIGIMTLSSSFILALKGKTSLKHKHSFFNTHANASLHEIDHILKFILIITFISEFIGAILLTIGFYIQGFSLFDAIHQGVFHSVSAFCNAGFSTFDDSMIDMNVIIKYTVMMLIIIGGLGYHVIYEIIQKRKSNKRYSLHTKIVLISSVGLIFIGAILIFLFENGNVSITDSLFQSVTTRTAGFNTIDLTKMHYLSLFFMTLLMFIGASPGSTGGGIKTTTFFIVIVSLFKILKGKTEIVIFNRRISNEVVLKSFAVLTTYFMVIFIGTLFLMFHTSYGFLNTMFEVVSALGTVGLSLGVSAEVGVYGKLILIIIMFVGRVGPVSLAMLTFRKHQETKIKYPEESIY